MKSKICKYQIKGFLSLFIVLIGCVSCLEMKTELDIGKATFPPKLCVTAILDGADGTFSITITEGRALSDYKNMRPYEPGIKRNGEIRLYEDNRLILNEAGVFDLGHHFETPVTTNPGSVYRLEVELDGYQTVTSTSTMPYTPDVRATIDTSIVVTKTKARYYPSLYGLPSFWYTDSYIKLWPVTLQWGNREQGRNYYVLEMYERRTTPEGSLIGGFEGEENCGIIVTDLSKLQDNPEVEFFDAQEIEIEPAEKNYDAYHFPVLLMSDLSFTNDNASLIAYKTVAFKGFSKDEIPAGSTPVIYNYTLTLRVRHITEATFRYYRSLAQQNTGVDFFTEPVNITGNIENGYGGFTVFSAVDLQLLEYQYLYYIWEEHENETY